MTTNAISLLILGESSSNFGLATHVSRFSMLVAVLIDWETVPCVAVLIPLSDPVLLARLPPLKLLGGFTGGRLTKGAGYSAVALFAETASGFSGGKNDHVTFWLHRIIVVSKNYENSMKPNHDITM